MLYHACRSPRFRLRMVVGIFTSWDLTLLEKPETILERNLKINPTFPFTTLTGGLYVLRIRTARWMIGVLFGLITTLATVVAYMTTAELNEFVVFPIMVFTGCMVMASYHVRERTIVIDKLRKVYEFYRGQRLIYKGHIHNIYIQLKGQNSGGGDVYYSVVIGGFLIDEEPITGSSTKKEKLGRMARRLAAALDINYFDSPDKSRYHIIRHRCPYENRDVCSKTALP